MFIGSNSFFHLAYFSHSKVALCDMLAGIEASFWTGRTGIMDGQTGMEVEIVIQIVLFLSLSLAQLHSFGAYYRLFLCNKIVISGKTQSECQFFSKKAKSRDSNRQKNDKIYNILLFLLQKTSPKSIVLRTYVVSLEIGCVCSLV